MSGHNKWSQIKHKKAASDAKKSNTFAKLIRAITIAARSGTDPIANLRLKAEIERARQVNMPTDTIERALDRVRGSADAQLQEMTIELIGPGGVGILVEAISESTNHTMQEIKNIIAKTSIKIVPPGSTAWMFERHDGILVPIAPSEVSPDARKALTTIVEQLEALDDVNHVTTSIS
jgi:YebC/PmpR family DNA-binding regulatory protein